MGRYMQKTQIRVIEHELLESSEILLNTKLGHGFYSKKLCCNI